MSHLITLDNVSLAFGLDVLLDQVKLTVNAGERVCLIGRNGAGKSSLLKVIEGVLKPDAGEVRYKSNLRLARLDQELPRDMQGTVYEYVASGLAHIGELLAEYHALIHRLETIASEEDLNQLARLQKELDVQQGWKFEQKIKTTLSRLELDPDKRISELSGGWQRRAALAKALVSSPELLLLDEPTNHLDIEAIQWLEDELAAGDYGLIFITHDRAFLKRLATRIIELDRGILTSWPGDYDNFLRRKEEMLHAEEKQNALFDKKLAQEERWIRQGIKARRTRNEGRVRALIAMREERSKRRNVQGKVSFELNKAENSGHLVFEAEHITQSFNNKCLINDFSIRIMRGDRIGLVGPNGVGKSTLLNILLGKLNPDKGTVKQGTKLQVAYFDQLRSALDLEATVVDNVAQGREIIEINGKKQHIIGYLNDFLFSPKRALTPVKALSGGECNRLVLAKLFSQPANLLVLDEPTNDLDIETLELLEELLGNFQGTVLLVSHDREFLNNVVTSTLVFKGDGKIEESVGGYQDWMQSEKEKVAAPKVEKASKSASVATPAKKLSFNEQRELNLLPGKIEALEKEINQLQEMIGDEKFYTQDHQVTTKTLERLAEVEEELAKAYKRWEELG